MHISSSHTCSNKILPCNYTYSSATCRPSDSHPHQHHCISHVCVCVSGSDSFQMWLYLLADASRCQLVVVHHEPHQVGRIDHGRIGHGRDGVVLEVQVFDTWWDDRHRRQAPPIAVHGRGEGGVAVAHLRTLSPRGLGLQGAEVVAPPPMEPGEWVVSMGEGEWQQGREEEDDHQPHGHSHSNLHKDSKKKDK